MNHMGRNSSCDVKSIASAQLFRINNNDQNIRSKKIFFKWRAKDERVNDYSSSSIKAQ